jgi:hypothetical protein
LDGGHRPRRRHHSVPRPVEPEARAKGVRVTVVGVDVVPDRLVGQRCPAALDRELVSVVLVGSASVGGFDCSSHPTLITCPNCARTTTLRRPDLRPRPGMSESVIRSCCRARRGRESRPAPDS